LPSSQSATKTFVEAKGTSYDEQGKAEAQSKQNAGTQVGKFKKTLQVRHWQSKSLASPSFPPLRLLPNS